MSQLSHTLKAIRRTRLALTACAALLAVGAASFLIWSVSAKQEIQARYAAVAAIRDVWQQLERNWPEGNLSRAEVDEWAQRQLDLIAGPDARGGVPRYYWVRGQRASQQDILLIEDPSVHDGAGAAVLFADGHAEFQLNRDGALAQLAARSRSGRNSSDAR